MATKLIAVRQSWLARNDEFPINAELLYQMIPTGQKLEAESLLKRLADNVAVNSNNLVKYADGSIGSHIIDLVKFHLKVPGAQKPRDYSKFLELAEPVTVRKTSKPRKPKATKPKSLEKPTGM